MARRQGAGVMPHILRITDWPLTVKVPLLVAGLMVAVAMMVSQVVLSRLIQDQENNLRLLTSAYLDGLSAAAMPAVIRADVWETFDALDRARGKYAGLAVRHAIVELPNGTILASSDPLLFPVQGTVPAQERRQYASDNDLAIDESMGQAWLSRTLSEGGVPVGRLLAEIDIKPLLKVRREVMTTLILVNGALTFVFAMIGYFVVKRMVQPLGVLVSYVERAREGSVEPIPDQHRRNLASEFGRLFDRFNAMARSLNEREALASRLAEEEKYAMLGKLASGMAHEVNNPLGGMLNAIDTLQVHGDDPFARQKSLEFLKRGLAGIRNVVRATLVTYKGGSGSSLLTPSDIDDLQFLVQHETGIRRLKLDWRNSIAEPVPIDGAAIRQITLNLLLNACAASPPEGTVTVVATCEDGLLGISIADEGPGLPVEMALLVDHSAHLSAPPRGNVGLGLWTTGRLVHDLGGRITLEEVDRRTRIAVTLPVERGEALHAVA
jgi:signal transduction histidine kinase